MKYVFFAILALVPVPAFAQADCEPQPGQPQDQQAPQGGEESPLPMPSPTDEPRPEIDSLTPAAECDGGEVPEVRNGTFVAPRARQEQVDPGVMANIAEDMGDWKGAAQEYESAGSWAKAALNWDRLSKDLSKMGLWKEAGDASRNRFQAEKKATNDELRKAQDAVTRLLKALAADPENEDIKKMLAGAWKELDEATRRWKAVRAAEKEERKRAEAKKADEAKKAGEAKKADEAKKAEEANKAEEAKKKGAEEAKKGPKTIAQIYEELKGGDSTRSIEFVGNGNRTTWCGSSSYVETAIANSKEDWYDPVRKCWVKRVRIEGVWYVQVDKGFTWVPAR